MKVYSGAAAAARQYVEADRARADEYYLTEGTGVARRFTATDGDVTELAPLTGDRYEAWVAGRDPETGEPRGRLRTDDRAVRFVEVVVNGPKSWSLAAALHPDIAMAYDAAQDRAAGQIVAWLSGRATTRVGPAGGQMQVPVEVLEAVTVRHHTSRAGDPHRHLHLQINARVFAAGKWRGLHTVGTRDFLGAINGIGHADMACDPELNAAFAAHGYAKDGTGEILELAEYVGPMSARNAQIARNVDRYERERTAAHPGEHPGPALRRAWDARAWADNRPDKVIPRPGADLTERWRIQLENLGHRDPAGPVGLRSTAIGGLNRDELAARALTRLAAARSAWNAADVRGEVERLIAAAGVVADAAVRIELAEDLTARALARCVPLLSRDGAAVAVPEHIRAWTSRPVLAVEGDLRTRLAARAAAVAPAADPTLPVQDLASPVARAADMGRLDAGQAAAVAALAGNRQLVVIEGAAGAGKTTTLAATRQALEARGRRLMVVTPTLKAAKVAAAEVGTAAGSAARLAFEYGWRWNDDGAWTRLAVGQTDPVTGRVYAGPTDAARLRPGDLLVVDEAGMLNQDTAHALLTVADECRVRVALIGDRHQLAAVGRGGVLELAVGQVDADACLTLQGLHRFTRTGPDGRTVPDTGYADLTLLMRTGQDPGAVFDALLARGQIRVHPDPQALRDGLAETVATSYAAGQRPAVVSDTREQVAELNSAIRDRLVAAGRVDDRWVVTTRAGERLGVGDRIVTRRNDPDLDVANRDVWVVASVGSRGELLVTPADVTPAGPAPAGAPAAGRRVLPAGYVAAHVELAYASTAHGAQGDTVATAHLVVGESTGAASAYVGMTRGRTSNTARLVAADLEDAREQWVTVFARDRADLGPAHAGQLAAAEAARYAPPRPLEQILAELRQARQVERRCIAALTSTETRRAALSELIGLGPGDGDRLPQLQARHRQACNDAEQARERADVVAAAVAADAAQIRDALLTAWDTQRPHASAAARIVQAGPGRFGGHRAGVMHAQGELTAWADGWRPQLPDLPTDREQIAAVAGGFDDRPRLWTAFDQAAGRDARAAHPEHATLAAAAATARAAADAAQQALADAHRDDADRTARFGSLAHTADPADRLAAAERDLTATREQLAAAQARIATLQAEPAYRARPADQRTDEPANRRTSDSLNGYTPAPAPRRLSAPDRGIRQPRPEDIPYNPHRHGTGRGVSR